MTFNLTKNLCFFDVESTGLNVISDRILQIGILKFKPGKEEPEELNMLINPGIPISEEAMNVHGITPKMLANKPTFAQVAQQIFNFIGDADLAGYNSNRFDIPILLEEFARVGLEMDMTKRRTVDVQRIFYKMEPRTLRAALKFYCDEDIDNAHDAMADVRATVAVFKGQLDRYKGVNFIDEDGKEIEEPIKNDIKTIHDFTNDLKTIDATQRLKYDNKGEIVFNFGKYNGEAVAKVIARDKQYYQWIMTKEFSFQVKQIVKNIMTENERSNNSK
jgi:DNA polymerase III subunit epsilon